MKKSGSSCNLMLTKTPYHMNSLMTKPLKWHVRPAKTQISLGIRPVWSESSLSTWRKLGSLATHWAHSEDVGQTDRIVNLLVLSWCGSYNLWCAVKDWKKKATADRELFYIVQMRPRDHLGLIKLDCPEWAYQHIGHISDSSPKKMVYILLMWNSTTTMYQTVRLPSWWDQRLPTQLWFTPMVMGSKPARAVSNRHDWLMSCKHEG